ncbi:MAG TPA: hypothetical protein VJK52_00080, partial [Candidatus Nanoarchaeia archaeon]|nr:hypothetical protein [Candidatus Nanoarchaeia archaeon]
MHDVTDLARQLTDIEPNSLLARIKALHLAKIAYAGATAKETARSVYDAQALELMDIHAEHDPWY